MSSSGESASPGVSFSPGFLGAILLPGLGGTTSTVSAFLGPALVAAALALSFSSLALAASCALVTDIYLTIYPRPSPGLGSALCGAPTGAAHRSDAQTVRADRLGRAENWHGGPRPQRRQNVPASRPFPYA